MVKCKWMGDIYTSNLARASVRRETQVTLMDSLLGGILIHLKYSSCIVCGKKRDLSFQIFIYVN